MKKDSTFVSIKVETLAILVSKSAAIFKLAALTAVNTPPATVAALPTFSKFSETFLIFA